MLFCSDNCRVGGRRCLAATWASPRDGDEHGAACVSRVRRREPPADVRQDVDIIGAVAAAVSDLIDSRGSARSVVRRGQRLTRSTADLGDLFTSGCPRSWLSGGPPRRDRRGRVPATTATPNARDATPTTRTADGSRPTRAERGSRTRLTGRAGADRRGVPPLTTGRRPTHTTPGPDSA